MNSGKDAAEVYLQQIKDCMYALAPSEIFIDAIRDDCYVYLEEHPNCTLEDLINRFGKPETIAKDYLGSLNVLTPEKVVKTKRRKKIIITILVLAICGALITAGIYLYDLYQISQGTNTDVIVIEE